MAKRTRGTGRPGQRRAIHRPASRATSAPATSAAQPAPSAPRPASLTAAEEARAAELEAQIVAEERAAETAQRRTRARSSDAGVVRTRDTAPLAVRAANEYAYVRRDIVRIGRVALVMALVLTALHILINVLGVITV